MGETSKLIQTAKTPDRVESMEYLARAIIAKQIGVKVSELGATDFKKLTDLMAKTKKPVEFMMSFDGDWFSYFTRVGTVKGLITSVSIAAETDFEKRGKILEGLVSYGVATKAQVDALNKAHPDTAALAALKSQLEEQKKKVTEELKKFEELKKKYAALGGK
jgi:hypothetical protein